MRRLLTTLTLFCTSVAGGQTPPQDLLAGIKDLPAMSLDNFKDLALRNNPTIRQAEALVAQSDGEAKQAGLYPNPSVGYQGEEIRGGSYRGGKQGAFVQQTIVLGGKLALRRDVYHQQAIAGQLGVAEQRCGVLSDVGQTFYSALAAQQILAVRQRLLSLALDAATTAHQLANVGQADAPDVLQAEVEAEQAKLDFTTAQRDYIQAFYMLAAVAGKPDLPVSPLSGDIDHPPQIDTKELTARIATASPSVKRARQQITASEAQLRSARREAIPDLQIHAGAQNNFEPLDLAPGKAVGMHAFVTAGVTLPVFNRNQGNVAAAAAALTGATEEVRRVQLAVRNETEPLLQGYLASKLEAERYRTEIIPRAERAYKLYLEKYKAMAAAYPQVLVSQRTLFTIQITYIKMLEQVWRSATALQNYSLSSGLTSPVVNGPSVTYSNLPNSADVGAQ